MEWTVSGRMCKEGLSGGGTSPKGGCEPQDDQWKTFSRHRKSMYKGPEVRGACNVQGPMGRPGWQSE